MREDHFRRLRRDIAFFINELPPLHGEVHQIRPDAVLQIAIVTCIQDEYIGRFTGLEASLQLQRSQGRERH